MSPHGDKGTNEGGRLAGKVFGTVGRVVTGENKAKENNAEPRDQRIVIKG